MFQPRFDFDVIDKEDSNELLRHKNIIHNQDVLDFLHGFGGKDLFDMAIIDPPYNFGKDFGNDSDKQVLADYIQWSIDYINETIRLVKPNAPIYVYGFAEILAHIAVNFPMNNQRWLVWHYTNKTVAKSKFWQRSHESILCLWKGNKPALLVDNIREDYTDGFLKNSAGKVRNSKYCRYSNGTSKTIYKAHENGALPRDVIKISTLAGGSGSKERVAFCNKCETLVIGKARHNHNEENLIIHPTQKPLQLTEKLIKGSNPNNILIPFCGSGSECVVAKKLLISYYTTELNKDYINLANKWLEME